MTTTRPTVTVALLRAVWDAPTGIDDARGSSCLTLDQDGDTAVTPISTSDLRPDLSVLITDVGLLEYMDGEWDNGVAAQLAEDLNRDLGQR